MVDDDARLRGLLSRYLTEQGFRVTTAADAAEARDQLRFVHPDLMVLDVMMPGESGLAFTAALRQERATTSRCCCSPPAARRKTASPASRPAPTTTCGKPFEPLELVLRIRALLRRVAPAPPRQTVPAGPVPLGTAELRRDARRADAARTACCA